MSKPTRYEPVIEEGTYYFEIPDGRLEVGPVDGIVDLLGGEKYTLEYTAQQASVSWLRTDDDATITIDVRETLATMGFTEEVVSNLVNCPLNEEGEAGYPKRTELFADLLREILDSKGNVDF